MSYYFRERPRFGERFRGKSGDELLKELKQQFNEDRPLFDSTTTTGSTTDANDTSRPQRDPFERHTSFPRGFPFDDEGFGRRADIRSHLDDLAARHPEFADHLIGPPWADVPFAGGGGSLHRNRNRRASNDRNNYHHPDEDTRSQTSAGSGVSSHSSESEEQKQQKPPKSSGLRNNHTLDIGQHQHNMENPQQQRNVKSMSAPPENRNNQNDQPGNPRFVSRVDITPQGGQQTTNQTPSQQSPQPHPTQREKSSQQQQQQKPQPQSQQSHGNVRHIPIFVEGRDEPVIAKDTDHRAPPPQAPVDEPDFPRRQRSPPQFQRPSHFNSQQHFNKHPPGWSTFQDPFFEHTTGQWPSRSRDSSFGEFRRPQQPEKSRAQQTQYQEPPQTKRNASAQQHHQQPQNEPQPEAPPKPRQQVQPKDPLEKVALVQKEVDSLTEQVKQFTGNSRQDKQYMYLDEMLTRELIKLDDIDTEGKENVRHARKQAIKSIQESISLLESKAPLPGQQQESQSEEKIDQPMESKGSEDKPAESMDTSEPPTTEEQKAIPLPPPSSPTKTAAPEETQVQEEPATKIEEKPSEQISITPIVEAPTSLAQIETVAPTSVEATQQEPAKVQESKSNEEPMDSCTPTVTAPQQQQQPQDVEMRQPSPAKEALPDQEPKKVSEPPAAPVQGEKKDTKPEEPKQLETKTETITTTATATTEKATKEPPPVPSKPGKSSKKAKKTPKKQQPNPVSETAIPMPAPGQ